MNHRIRVKICGVTRPEDAVQAALLGADAIGLVFYAKSPRNVAIAQARDIIAATPPFVTITGLFVNADPLEVEKTLAAVPLDLLQFHGDEPPQYCVQFNRPYLKAVRMKPDVELIQEAQRHQAAKALLLDAYTPNAAGGAGVTFDWRRIPEGLRRSIVLAGGLNTENVKSAIQTIQPYGVDVSSGVESSPGIKSITKIQAFIEQVHHAVIRNTL